MEAPASPVLAAALRWCKRGAAPIPVRFREKVPIGEAWQKQRITAADAPGVFTGAPLNLGILWGEPSGHVVDVDLDWREACAIAAALLPATATYGRASSRQSHRLYCVPGAVTGKWTVPAELVPDGHKAVVLELRAEGTQSVVPPSTHPTGELYEWARERKPQPIEYAALVRRLNLVAAGAVLVRYWREGVRHNIALALAGAALSSGYPAEEVAALITAIAETAGDPEARDRARAVQSSSAALAAGRPATGVPKLAELVGEPTVAVLKRWLELASAVPLNTQGGTVWTPDDSAAGLAVRNVETIEEKPMHWLWPNRLARGKLHMLAGEPGLSKSVLTCAIAGIVSTGSVWPLDGTRCEPGEVLMLNVEDDPADTIRPRLRAAGADLSRVSLIEAVRTPDGKQRGMTLADVALLERYLEEHPGRFVLLVCDPIGALMADRDTHRDSEVRSLLAPLAALAMRQELAILLVAHLNKSAGTQALHRIVGSIGFAAAVRMVYFLARDHDDADRLLLVPGKANLAPMGMAGLSYELESIDLGKGIVAPRIVWHDVPEMRSANEVLSPPRPEQAGQEQTEIGAWLRDRLAAGPVLVRVLQDEARLKVTASWRTIERTAGKLGVVGIGESKCRTWELPNDAEPKRQTDITTARQEPASVVMPVAVEHSDTDMSTCRAVGLSVCRDAGTARAQNETGQLTAHEHVDRALDLLGMAPAPTGEISPADVAAFLRQSAAASPPLPAEDVQQALALDTAMPGVHPCTDCAKLHVGSFCKHYQHVMPEPGKPNACVHFEQRQPDVPWA